MPVMPLFLDCVGSYEALVGRLGSVCGGVRGSIGSVVVDGAELDLLAVLRVEGGRHFYFERDGVGMLGLGAVREGRFEGGDRFGEARRWMEGLGGAGEGVRFCCGFSFFDEAGGDVFLPRWLVLREKSRVVVVVCWELDGGDIEGLAGEIWGRVMRWKREGAREMRDAEKEREEKGSGCVSVWGREMKGDKVGFLAGVRGALGAIDRGEVEKVVLGQVFEAGKCVDLVGAIDRLREMYSGCYVFSEGDDDMAFFGASPERLVSVWDGVLETDALAGSARRGVDSVDDALLGKLLLESFKDGYEHRLVIDFIQMELVKLGLEGEMGVPMLMRLPNIQHLHTPIVAKLMGNIHVLDVVGRLHPTPAVAGVPRSIACALIRRFEGFDRGRFAGPIGWVDLKGNGEFAVGIRSGIWREGRVRVFGGAGVVAGSDPGREWAEVLMKVEGLGRALGLEN